MVRRRRLCLLGNVLVMGWDIYSRLNYTNTVDTHTAGTSYQVAGARERKKARRGYIWRMVQLPAKYSPQTTAAKSSDQMMQGWERKKQLGQDGCMNEWADMERRGAEDERLNSFPCRF